MYTAHHTFTSNLFSREQSTSREENSAQGWLSVDPWASKYPYVTPYNFVENNPVMLIDPNGRGPTEYKDEDGKLITKTNDGSDDVITVPKEQEVDFRELVEVTPENMSDSKEWNDHFKTEFLDFETTDDLKVLDNASSQWSRQKLINYYQNKSYGNWVEYLGAEVLSQNANPLNHLPAPIVLAP